MATKADIRNRVLKNIGVLASGQTASAADASDVDEVIESVYAMLDDQFKGLPWNVDNVPEKAVLPMVHIVSAHAASAFDLAMDERAALASVAAGAEKEIAKQVSRGRSGQPVQADYF